MNRDPIEALSDLRLLELSADLQVQLERGTGTRPMLWILSKARQQAAAAIVQFSILDPTDVAAVRLCQTEIARYDDLVRWCRDLLAAGREIEEKMNEQDREDISSLFTPDEAHMHGRYLQRTDT
jgi:hypothetical protein